MASFTVPMLASSEEEPQLNLQQDRLRSEQLSADDEQKKKPQAKAFVRQMRGTEVNQGKEESHVTQVSASDQPDSFASSPDSLTLPHVAVDCVSSPITCIALLQQQRLRDQQRQQLARTQHRIERDRTPVLDMTPHHGHTGISYPAASHISVVSSVDIVVTPISSRNSAPICVYPACSQTASPPSPAQSLSSRSPLSISHSIPQSSGSVLVRV